VTLNAKDVSINKFTQLLKTTAIGGLLFLLPLIVVGALIGKVTPIIQKVAEVVGDVIPFEVPGGIALHLLLASVVVLLICFSAGLLARRSFGKRISESFEKYLLTLVPRYGILKDQMAGRIGGDATKSRMKPVLVKFDDFLRIGFEIERNDAGLVTVYLPGAPDTWSGISVLMNAQRVEPLDLKIGDAVALCEQLGRGSAALLASKASESS